MRFPGFVISAALHSFEPALRRPTYQGLSQIARILLFARGCFDEIATRKILRQIIENRAKVGARSCRSMAIRSSGRTGISSALVEQGKDTLVVLQFLLEIVHFRSFL